MNRVVVFGATGYTGRLAARACVERGLRPVLAGRSLARLEPLAEQLGGLEVQVADADRASSVRALVGRGDVLISTVGPYLRYGEAAVTAAVDAGAHYADLAGEPAFVRRVFTDHGPRAERRGSTLLPAFGHDWVPGNLAAALALRESGPRARRLEVGYFDYLHGKWYTGVPMSLLTSGTRATLASAEPPDSYAVRAGELVPERLGRRIRRFSVDGRRMSAFSYGGTEQLAIRRLAPELTDVEVFLGWLGQGSRLMGWTIGAMAAASRLPIVRAVQERGYARALEVTGEGPDGWPHDGVCRTVAVVRDAGGGALAQVDVVGPTDAYRLSADLLAWAADRLLGGHVLRAGACGPVDGFGLDVVEPAFADLGLRRVGAPRRSSVSAPPVRP
jgi:short subunit dehydrogenase-like uncharacterized protein